MTVIQAETRFARGNPGAKNYRTPRQRLVLRIEDAWRAVVAKHGRPVGRFEAVGKMHALDPSLKSESQYDIGTIVLSIFNSGIDP